jgi:predicted peptidase
MKRALFLAVPLAFALCYVHPFFAATNGVAPDTKDPQYQAKGDQKRTYKFPGTDEEIPYHLYVPMKWTPTAKLPLVIVLHGGSSLADVPFQRGDGALGKVAEERGYIVASVTGYKPNAGWNCPFPMVEVPRQPRPAAAPNANATPNPNAAPRAAAPPPPTAEDKVRSEQDVLNVADLVAQEYNVDRSRIYLMGNSIGGTAVWYLGEKYPERWAAISPSDGPIATDGYPFDRLKTMPVLVIHGDMDTTSDYNASVKDVDAAKEHGVAVEFLTVKGGDHLNGFTKVLPETFDFFAQHSKK